MKPLQKDFGAVVQTDRIAVGIRRRRKLGEGYDFRGAGLGEALNILGHVADEQTCAWGHANSDCLIGFGIPEEILYRLPDGAVPQLRYGSRG